MFYLRAVQFTGFLVIFSAAFTFVSANEKNFLRVAPPAKLAESAVPQYLQDISVTIRANGSEGSGVLKTTNDGQVWIWTCGHVIENLRKERTSPDKKSIVEFNDAKVVKVLTEAGRKVGELTFDAEVIRYSDAKHGEDLALLRLRTKKFKPAASVVFYLEDDIPNIGTKLLHCGSLLGTAGSNSVTNGIVSQHGRVLFNDVIFDQTNCATFPGSSGGIVCLERDGRYVGMLVRGAGETFSLYVPIRRMLVWAKKVDVLFAIDDSIPIPIDTILKKTPVDDAIVSKVDCEKTKTDSKAFPTKEFNLVSSLSLFRFAR